MSLINDMLRDLSDQQANRAQDETLMLVNVQAAAWEQEKVAYFFQHSRLPLFFICLVIFITIFITSNFVLTQYTRSMSDISLTKIASPVTGEELAGSVQSTSTTELAGITVLPTTAEYIASPVANYLEAQSELPVIITTQAQEEADHSQSRIYQLIDQASRAITLDRLTSPENDNAYFYYRELLTLDGQNVIAIAGIEKIADRYIQMAEKSLQKNDLTKAGIYFDKASLVAPGDHRIEQLRKTLLSQEMRSQTSSQNKFTASPESVAVSDPFEKIENAAVINSTESNLAITPNVEYLDQQTVKKAADLIAQASKSAALDLLKNHIQLYVAPASEKYLLDLYHQDKDFTAMQLVLDSNLNMSLVEKMYYRARANILQGDNQSAIRALESQLVQAAAHENYRALLAGLYQREQLYAQATSAYRNLLKNFIPKPAYWLGLALALDAQNQSSTAVHAYKKVLEFEPLDTEVKIYAQNRIMQLSRDY